MTISTKTDSSGNYTLNLRIGTFSVKVTNSSGTEIGTFQLKATSNTAKPEVVVTSGGLSVVVNTVTSVAPITTPTIGEVITRDWATFTDMLDGTVKLEVKDGTFGGNVYFNKVLYFAKCSYGQMYNLSSNSCLGNALTIPISHDACNGITIGGKTGWRVPSKNELKLLINCNNKSELPIDSSYCSNFTSPAINKLFPNTPSGGHYWSTTTEVVCFCDGNTAQASGNGYSLYVRCVNP